MVQTFNPFQLFFILILGLLQIVIEETIVM